MDDHFIRACTYTSEIKTTFSRISELLLFREPETDVGLGSHYLIDLVGTGSDGVHVVALVCQNHGIPLLDLRNQPVAPIRDIVKTILETSPPRCAIVIDTRENELMQKVRTRIAGQECDLRYRRVVFCLTTHTTPGTCLHVPGSTDDKLAMLLYHIPTRIQDQTDSPKCFRPLAEAMVDYSLFEPRIWRCVYLDGTLEEFMSTALYQVVRRVRTDTDIDIDYPSFETPWRRALSTRLQDTLHPPPDATCPGIHRVIPIGVSPQDAIQALQCAVPKNLQNPYAITVNSVAIDNQGGSIVITQPMHYTVVHITCLVNPDILVDVCRELRVGHKAVVCEIHTLRLDQREFQRESREKLSEYQQEARDKLVELQQDIARLSTVLSQDRSKRKFEPEQTDPGHACCSKKGCRRLATERFRSGKLKRQCSACLLYVTPSI